jgi:uncharacterized protein (DUF58 family)
LKPLRYKLNTSLRQWLPWQNARVQRVYEAWSDKRHADGLSTTLAHRNVYILPTKAGFVYAALLLVLLIGSINYQLNLGYLLTFMLAGVGAMSMHITHNNLRGLTLALAPPEPTFAASPGRLKLVLTALKAHRYGISLWCAGELLPVQTDVEPGAPSQVTLSFPCPTRGLYPVPRITLETRFPLGLWRAWSHWRPTATLGAQILVYPTPESPAKPLPSAKPVAMGGEASAHRQSVGGEFDGVRAYRAGDALKRLVWKKYAKSDELVSRDDMALVQSMLVLDFADAGALDTEARLSRLTAWVLACERSDLPFTLQLPTNRVECDHSTTHTHVALRELSLYKQ